MACSGPPHRIEPEGFNPHKPLLRQTIKKEFPKSMEFETRSIDTEPHTKGIVTPSKLKISIKSNRPPTSSKNKYKNMGKIPRKKLESVNSYKQESLIVLERKSFLNVAKTSPQHKDPRSTTWEKKKTLGRAYLYNSAADIRGIPIAPEDPWKNVWDKLKHSGWTWGQGNGLVSYYYYPPGKTQPVGTVGVDYFTSEEAIKDYARKRFNWIGDKIANERRGRRRKQHMVDISEKKPKHGANSNKNNSEEESLMTKEKKNSSKKKSKSKSSLGGRSWGEVTNTKETKQNKNTTKIVSLTPQDKNIKSQILNKPIVSSSSETSIDSFTKYRWKNLWADLKMEGWTVIRASKYNNLHDWYYMKPNCDPALPQFQLGRDYFQFEEDVIEHIRKLDKEKRTKKKSKRVTLDSISGEAANNIKPQASSRRNAVISEFDKEAAVESSVIEGSICTPENNSPFTPSSSVISESECWWLYEPIPKSAKIWPILSKLGFKYLSGMYCLPGTTKKTIEPGIYSFSDQQDLAKLLSVQGIPNLFSEDGRSNLNRSDEETILKWVSVAQLPTGINSINSLSMLSKVPILSDFEAWNILHQKLRYSFEDGNYYLPLKIKSAFQSLEELKHHIRGHGLQVDRKLQKGMRKNFELLGVILWASRAPLPKHKMAERLDCYGTGHKVSANVQPDEKKNDIAKIQMHNDTKNEKDKIVGLPTHAENIERTNDAVGDKCARDNKEVKVVDENVDSGILEELNPETSIREDKSVSLEESLSTKNMTLTINRDATIDEVSSLEKQRNSSFSESSEQSEGEEVYHDTVENKKSPNAVVGETKFQSDVFEDLPALSYEDAIEVLREEERKNDLHYEPSIIVDNGSTDKMKVGSHLPDEQNDKVQGNSFFFTQPLQDNEDGFDGDAAHGYPWLL